MEYKNMEWITPHKELQDLTGVFDIRSARRYHVDLRKVMDDKTVLKNPHKGWFWHYVDNGFYREQYRKGYTPEDVEDFPGLKVIYIRFDWGDVEKEKGVYDFSIIDEIMDRFGGLGYTFAMRAVASETGNPYATPHYVFEEGAKCYMITGKGAYSDHTSAMFQPDFADPIFLHYLEKFLAKLGEKYNKDPRLEYIDIGSYGTWGEGHTIDAEERIYPIEVVKKHFDLHVKYFPDKFVLCNDDHIMGYVEKGAEQVYDLFEYADARGLGLQDDSISIGTYGRACGYDTLRAPWLFDRLYKNAPISLEYCHWGTYIKKGGYKWYRDGFGVLEAMKNAHTTFAGFHGYPREWLSENRSLAEYGANRLGYWYFLTEAILPPMTNTTHNKITLTVENRGWAQAYYRYDMKVLLKNAAGEKYIIDIEEDNRKWFPGETYTLEKMVDCRQVPAGEYEIGIGLFEGEQPIQWALKKEICCDGFYLIGKTEVREVK